MLENVRDAVVTDRYAIYLADCLDVLPQIAERSIDAIVTDPPYGHNNNNNGDLIHRWEAALGRGPVQQPRAIANDGAEANELLRAVLPEFARVLVPGGCCCCCCCGGGPDPQFARWSLWMDEHLDFKQTIVWDKGPMGMGWHYRRSYETVLVAMRPGAACKWYDETHRIENVIRPGGRIRKIIPSKDDHPTPKPVALAEHFIGLHTQEGETVFDPFMGRAWVGEAAMNLGRRFVGVEIDEEHYRHAVERMRTAAARTTLFYPEAPPGSPAPRGCGTRNTGTPTAGYRECVTCHTHHPAATSRRGPSPRTPEIVHDRIAACPPGGTPRGDV